MKVLQCLGVAFVFISHTMVIAEDSKVAQLENALGFSVQLKGKELQQYNILDRMQHHDVPGVSLAVIEDNKIAWVKSWGVKNVETGDPVGADSLFQAASISKPVAAYAAMRLVQEGRLSLTAPINTVLKQWRVPENDFTKQKPVTLAGLLSHTAGMTVHGFGGYALDAPYPDILAVLNGQSPANSKPFVVDILPGSKWRYSGGGYTVAQVAMEDVSGKDFVTLMDDLVLKPAGMRDSTYAQPLPENRRAQAVTAYRAGLKPVPHQFHAYPEMAAAGLWTTPTDLAKLALSVSKSWTGEEGALLSPELATEFLTEVKGSWGLGFKLEQHKSEVIGFSHGGANAGFRAYLVKLFDGRGVSIMTNSDTGGALLGELLVAIASVYDWPIHKPVERDWQPVTTDTLTGTYRITDGDAVYDFTVEREGEGLVIANPKYMPATPYYLEKQADGEAHFFNQRGRSLHFSSTDTGSPILHVFSSEAVRQ